MTTSNQPICPSTKPFNILSLAGGGINGTIPAGILKSIEETSSIRVADYFDLIVGTSTGGILALGLAMGIRAETLFEFYRSRGEKIFPISSGNLQNRIFNIFRPKYTEKVLEEELKFVFGDRQLGECCVPVVIPTYNLSSNTVRMFKTRHHTRFQNDRKIAAWKVARATSAAPTFYPICREIDSAQLIDGGVFANNPVMVGITEAIGVFGISPKSIRVLSIGTTKPVRKYQQKLDRSGIAGWALPLKDVFFDAQDSCALGQATLLIGRENLLHIDPAVAEGDFAMDRYQHDRHRAVAANCALHNMPEIQRRFLNSTATLGREALLNPVGQEVSHAS